MLAFTAGASEQADFSTPTGKTTSSLAPVNPKDLDNDFKKLFGRSESGSTSVTLPQSFTPQTGLLIDSKTRSRLLQEWDKKKNWLLNGNSKQADLGQENDKDVDPFDEVEGKNRTALEKRILGQDAEGKEEREREVRRVKKGNAEEASAESSDQSTNDKSLGARSSRNGSDKEVSRAYFSDPFNRTNPNLEKKKTDDSVAFGKKTDKDEDAETAATLARSSARMNQAFALPSSVAGPSTPSTVSALSGMSETLNQRSTHMEDMHNILGRDPRAPSSVAGILGGMASARPPFAAPAPAPASSFSQPPAFTPSAPPRRSAPIMEAQPDHSAPACPRVLSACSARSSC